MILALQVLAAQLEKAQQAMVDARKKEDKIWAKYNVINTKVAELRRTIHKHRPGARREDPDVVCALYVTTGSDSLAYCRCRWRKQR